MGVRAVKAEVWQDFPKFRTAARKWGLAAGKEGVAEGFLRFQVG